MNKTRALHILVVYVLIFSLLINTVPSSAAKAALADLSKKTGTPEVTETENETQSGELAAKGIPTDWWAQVQANLQKDEYQVTRLEPKASKDRTTQYQASNRANHFRTYFSNQGLTVLPRDTGKDETPRWSLKIRLDKLGGKNAAKLSQEIDKAVAKENRFEYPYGQTIQEWYVNSEAGLEQGFTILAPLGSQEDTTVQVDLAIETHLTPQLAQDGQQISFRDVKTGNKLTYSGLKATDANQRILPAKMQLLPCAQGKCKGKYTLQLVVETANAQYPLTIDPVLSGEDLEVNYFAASVASAGDVNGDGWDDVLIGAPGWNNGPYSEGKAFVYYGSSVGLSTTPDWSMESEDPSAAFGSSVGTAGDVNNDGYSDVIIGAPNYLDGSTRYGAALVFYGSADGLGTAANWTAEGEMQWSRFGVSVGTAGDVNGDGFSDVVVGSSDFNPGLWAAGAAYVFYGSASGLNATPAWTAEGNQNGEFFGEAVSTAGDVNQDGYDDIIVGARGFSKANDNQDEGGAFVYFGSATGLSVAPDWTMDGGQEDAAFGVSVSTAGDVNGDDYSDVIIGASGYDQGESDEGKAFVFYGSTAGLGLTPAWTAEVNQEHSYFGTSVSHAGDIDQDGYGDVLVGAPWYGLNEEDLGAVFVYHGSDSGLSATPNWTGIGREGAYGSTVSAAGDVNGDGYSDLVVGASSYDYATGRASVYYGSAAGVQSDQPDWRIECPSIWWLYDYRNTVDTAGDVNGDGFQDVIVGMFDYDNGQGYDGRVFVFFGSANGLSTNPDWTVINQQWPSFGNAVSTAGDVNGDGYSDVIVGADQYTDDDLDGGAAFVYYGSATGLGQVPNWKVGESQYGTMVGFAVSTAGDVNQDGYGDVLVSAIEYGQAAPSAGRVYAYYGSANGLSLSPDWTADGSQAEEGFGFTIGTAGDVNGDHYADVLIGAPGHDHPEMDEGKAFVYFGSAGGLNATPGWTAEGNQAQAYFGDALSAAGDVNQDTFDDILIGASDFDQTQMDEGMVFLYSGSPQGPSTAADWTYPGEQAEAYMGFAVGGGADMNGDGFSDIVVGAPLYDHEDADEGQLAVFYGAQNGVGSVPDWTAEGNDEGALLGFSAQFVGDVNGDGASDLLSFAKGIERTYLYEGLPIPIPIETPTPTVTPTPEPTETPTPVSSCIPTGTCELVLTSDGGFFKVGDVVEIGWEIPNAEPFDPNAVANWRIQFTLPATFAPETPADGVYDAAAHTFVITVPTSSGNVRFTIDPQATDAQISAELRDGATVLTTFALDLTATQATWIYKDEGGTAYDANDEIKAVIPADALPEDANVTVVEPAAEDLPAAPAGGSLIEVLAENLSGEEIHQLTLDPAPVPTIDPEIPDLNYNPQHYTTPTTENRHEAEIIVPFDPEDETIEPTALTLSRYDEESESWIPLPSFVDETTHTLHAWTDHFSLFSYGEGQADSITIPPLDAAQVSEFTGAASYAYSIEVPPGPGGATPSISLSYNSQSVEGMFLNTQAGWAGMGWSVNAGGAIFRNQGRRMGDTFSMVMGGTSMQLIPVSNGADGSTPYIDYKAGSDDHWRIRRYQVNTDRLDFPEGDWWVAWDKIGTKYTFDQRANYGTLAKINTGTVVKMRPWGWFLSKTTLANGQSITYEHQSDSMTKCYTGNADYCGYAAMGMYLRSISYNGGYYKILFDHDLTRSDYDYRMRTRYNDTRHLFERLTGIQVMVGTQVLREYRLTYYPYDDKIPVFPASKWEPVENGGKTGRVLVLKDITQYGVGGESGGTKLPPVTFTYGEAKIGSSAYNLGDYLHLSQVDNGQGGLVTFRYETDAPWHAVDGIANQKVGFGSGRVVPAYPILELGTLPVRPGGSYLLGCRFDSVDAAPQVRFSIQYKKTGVKTMAYSAPLLTHSEDFTPRVEYVTIPGDAEIATAKVENISGGTYFNTCYAMPVVTQHRVVTKIVTDRVTNKSQSFSYEYIGAAVNSPSISYAAALPAAERMVEPYSEFRGHSQVTVTGPNGLKTITTFNQWDSNQGRVARVDQIDSATGKLLSRTDTAWDRTIIETDPNLCAKKQGSAVCMNDLRSYWTFMTSQESRQYGTAGLSTTIFTGLRKEFSYDAAMQGGQQYGNLTQQIESSWNGTAWARYRMTRSRFFPTDTDSVYLTGLPGYNNQYRCSATTAGTTGGCLAPSNSTLIAQELFLYDNSTSTVDDTNSYSTPPTQGILTGHRTFLYFGDPATYENKRYLDVAYGYDAWDNLNTTKTYVSDNPDSTFAAGTVQTTTLTYDAVMDHNHALLVKKTNAMGQSETYQYSGNGATCSQPSSILDANNQTTTFDYDVFCRQKSVVRPGDSVAFPTYQYVYSNYASPSSPFTAEVVARIEASNNTNLYRERNFYNGLGQLIQTQTANATVSGVSGNQDILVDYEYDGYGRLTKQTIPYNVTAWVSGNKYRPAGSISHFSTTTTYDPLGRPLKKIRPDSTAEVTYSYTVNGSLLQTTIKDGLGKATQQLTDAFGRTAEVHPPDGTWMKYSYDQMDHLLTAQKYQYNTTTLITTTIMTYDNAGRKIKMVDPDMGTWYYQYDALANLKRQTDAKGQRTCLYYDSLNRLVGKQYRSDDNCPSSTSSYNVSYGYDTLDITKSNFGVGHRTTMTDLSGSTTWTYDKRGQMTKAQQVITGVGTFNTLWSYNSAGLITSMVYPVDNTQTSSETLDYTYVTNSLKLQKVTGSASYVSQIQYDAPGRMVNLVRNTGTNALSTSYDFKPWGETNGIGRLNKITTVQGSNTIQSQQINTYDGNGNIKAITDPVIDPNNPIPNYGYNYDNINRLRSVTGSLAEGYTYNPNGNIGTKGSSVYTYGDTAHPQAVTKVVTGTQTRTYAYDANGNMTSRDGWVLEYDKENHMTKATKGAIIANFTYDGDGNRVKSVITNGATTTTAYIGNWFEWSGSTTTMKRYYYAGSERIGMRTGTGTGTSGLKWLLSNYLGGTAFEVNASTKIADVTLRYKPWGEADTGHSSGTPTTSYQYTGQPIEAALGIYYYKARWYDPYITQFTQPDSIIPDPYNPLDWNRYSYARYNPIRYTDPTGHAVSDGSNSGACDPQRCPNVTPTPTSDEPTWTDEEISAMTPDGRKDSFVFAIGFPSSLHARNRNGMKIPTTLYWGLSIVYDNTGGIQLYSETLDISFKPRLELSPGEKANPSDLLGAGVSLTKGLIWKEGFNTEQYYGEATSWGGGLDIVTADYYESSPDRTLKGLDIGVSAGLPVSGWRISTFAERITPRIDLTFWSNNY